MVVARRFSTTSVNMYQSTLCTHPRRRGSLSPLLWEPRISQRWHSFACHPLPATCRRHSDNVQCCYCLILAIQEQSIEQKSASQLYIFLYSRSPDQRTNGQDFRFLQRYCRGFGSYGMWRCIVWRFPTFRKNVLPSSSRSDVSKKTDFHKNAKK